MQSAVTLRIWHIDLPISCVHLGDGTENAKFGKSHSTTLFPLGSDVKQNVEDWLTKLKMVLG